MDIRKNYAKLFIGRVLEFSQSGSIWAILPMKQ